MFVPQEGALCEACVYGCVCAKERLCWQFAACLHQPRVLFGTIHDPTAMPGYTCIVIPASAHSHAVLAMPTLCRYSLSQYRNQIQLAIS